MCSRVTASSEGGRVAPIALGVVGCRGAIRNLDPERGALFAVDEDERAAVRGHELGRDGKPETGATLARRALEGLKEVSLGARRKTRTGVPELDHRRPILAPGLHMDGPGCRRALALDGLYGIAAEIVEDAEHMLGVGIGSQLRVDIDLPRDASAGQAEA